jgi:hypothetical protein
VAQLLEAELGELQQARGVLETTVLQLRRKGAGTTSRSEGLSVCAIEVGRAVGKYRRMASTWSVSRARF